MDFCDYFLLSCNLQDFDLPPAGPAKAKPKTPAEAELLQLLGAVGIPRAWGTWSF